MGVPTQPASGYGSSRRIYEDGSAVQVGKHHGHESSGVKQQRVSHRNVMVSWLKVG